MRIVVAAAVPVSLAACGDDDASKQTFVQVGQVQQWIVNHECSRTGAVKGYPGYGGEGGGQIAQETFVCDNGKTVDHCFSNDLLTARRFHGAQSTSCQPAGELTCWKLPHASRGKWLSRAYETSPRSGLLHRQ